MRGLREVAWRGVGDVLGEKSLLADQPHSATVTALEPTLSRAVSLETINTALDKVPPLISEMLRGLSDRLVEQTKRAQD